MTQAMSPGAIITVTALLGVPGIGLVVATCRPRTSTATRLALILPLGYGTVALIGFPLAVLHLLTLPTIAIAWLSASITIWFFAIKKGGIGRHIASARTSLRMNPWRLASALLLFGWYAASRWTYQPLTNLAAAPLRYWADGVEIADAHGIPTATLQYGRLLAPTVSKVLLNAVHGAVSLVLGRAPLGPMSALLFVVSLGLALLVFALATELGLRFTAPLVVLGVVAIPRIPMSFASDLVAARAENWGRLAALGALLLFLHVLAMPSGAARRKRLVLAGVLLGVAAATHLVAAVAIVAFASAYVLARAIVDRSGKKDLRPLIGVAAIAAVVVSMAFLLPRGDLGFQAASGDASYASLRSDLDLPADFDPSLFIVSDGQPERLPVIENGPAHFLSWLSSVMQGRDPLLEPASPVALALPALAWVIMAGATLRWGNRSLRRLAVLSSTFAVIILGTGLAFSVFYDSFALSNFGNRRLIDYLAIPGVLLGAGLLEMAASTLSRRRGNDRFAARIGLALVLVLCLGLRSNAVAPSPATQGEDAKVLQWIAANVPCEGRVLADRRTVATFQAMTGHAGVVEGMGPHIRPDILTLAVGNILSAQEFFRSPSIEYLRSNGIAAVVLTTPLTTSMGGWTRFTDADPAVIESLPYLTKVYEGPTAMVFEVADFELNPALPSVEDAAGYDCPVQAALSSAGFDPAGVPWNGLN